MSVFPFEIVGFDLDGTLVDTLGDLTAAVNHALADAGRPPVSVDEVKPMIGGGAKLMLEKGLAATGGCPEDEFNRLYRLLLAYYEAHIAVHSRPFPGAVAALDELAAMGVKTAIVTNKFEGFAAKLLRELGLFDRFATVIGGDTLGKGIAKPSAAPILEMVRRLGGGRAAFVGDSIYDVVAAKNAGVPSVECSFGFLMGPVEELGADAVIDGFEELIPALRTLAAI
ncbi:MAG: HAD-IA family hydrolase [Sphingomonadaceae bacterium]|nr:HAD-IA family hydrolase [Sphingomonadaceae bacterium]